MGTYCLICSDCFEDNAAVLAAPCGHVFHSKCLMLWLNESKTCPECRSHVTTTNVLKLYFHAESHISVSNSSLENNIEDLKADIRTKEKEIDKYKLEKEELRLYVENVESNVHLLQQANSQYECEISKLNLRLKSLAELEAKANKIQQRNLALSNDLQHLNNVQLVVSGTEKDVQDVLKNCGTGPQAAKQLATYCSLLKRELQEVIKAKGEMKNEMSCLKKRLGIFVLDLKKARKKIKILDNQVSQLDKENKTLVKRILDSGIPSTSSACYESPIESVYSEAAASDIDMRPVSVPSEEKFQCKLNIKLIDENIAEIPPPIELIIQI